MATQLVDPIEDDLEGDAPELPMIIQLAQAEGDLSHLLDDTQLATIGAEVVRDYERDLGDRQNWEDEARDGLKKAAQEKRTPKDYPFVGRSSNVDYPLLAIASMQFNARAYPAICKSGNMVRCKVIGSDKGRPRVQMTAQGPIPIVTLNGKPMLLPEAQQLIAGYEAQQPANEDGQAQEPAPQPQPVWDIPPGAKTARAQRVSDYLNVYLEFRMDDWEEDTDQMLAEIPIVGCGFRKLWWNRKQKAAYVSALDLVLPAGAKSIKTTPRITEIMRDVFPFTIRQRMQLGEYRTVVLIPSSDDKEEPRILLEQHRYYDLDEDGVDEPYIITVDKETEQVLRIEANFDPDQVHLTQEGEVERIEPNRFYVLYPFLPNPSGSIYAIGFAHLLSQIGPLVNTTINQMIDAEHAAIAGGGFIGSGLRLQGNGQTNTLRWQPGEYKNVNASGSTLRDAIYERTFPGASAISFQILELMLGAAKELTSVKDVVTGNAPNTAPVGTTLALIEQGLQVFTAIYKRIYRSLGQEFGLIFRNLGKYGGEEAAEDYLNVLDDPFADFAKDFGETDMDLKPVADPSAVTNMQRIAKAQLLDGMRGKGLNDSAINKRVLEAADIEDIDELLPPPDAPPPPELIAQLRKEESIANYNDARAKQAEAAVIKTGFEMGVQAGGGDGQ